MLAYHNNPQLKQQILQQLQRSGWNVFIEDYKNGLGIPKTLIYLHDAINRGLPNDLAKNWPIRFISSIQVGADLSTIWREFVLWLLVDPADGVIKYTHPGTDAHRVILMVANLYQDGYTQQQMIDAAVTARAAVKAEAQSADKYYEEAYEYHEAAKAYKQAHEYHEEAYCIYDADQATAQAYYHAVAADAADAAYAVAVSIACNTAHVAHAAAHAAAHATATALASTATVLALAIARNAAYIKMSNKLIELLEKQEVKNDHK